MSERAEKSYNGELMKKGKENEEAILKWMEQYSEEILDFRDVRLAQRADFDFGIVRKDGDVLLAEVKSDKYIDSEANFLFEVFRINHFVKDKWFYLGWGWRSPAKKLIVRNPETYKTYVFDFQELRNFMGRYIALKGKRIWTSIVPTDKQKTTFNFIVPMKELINLYKEYIVEPVQEVYVMEAAANGYGEAASF